MFFIGFIGLYTGLLVRPKKKSEKTNKFQKPFFWSSPLMQQKRFLGYFSLLLKKIYFFYTQYSMFKKVKFESFPLKICRLTREYC